MKIPNYEGIAWDDIWRFNPQACSQWDGFRHFSMPMPDGSRAWYGGTTPEEIGGMESDRIGVGHWAQEGIAARGILIDYVSYAEKKGTPISEIEYCRLIWTYVLAYLPLNIMVPQRIDRCRFCTLLDIFITIVSC